MTEIESLNMLLKEPDSEDSPELFLACQNGLNAICELSGLSSDVVVRVITEEALWFKELYKEEKTMPDLLIARLTRLPTTLICSGTRKDIGEITQQAFGAISRISQAQDIWRK